MGNASNFNLDDLTRQVVGFLRKNGVLAGEPVFENMGEELVCVDPRGQWDEYYMQHPWWQPMKFDRHRRDFENIESMLDRTSYEEVQQKALERIPDSSDTLILEIGSRYGVYGAGWLAAQKPNARVLLMSEKEKECFKPKYLFTHHRYRTPKLVFERGEHLLDEPDMEKRVRALYRENGIFNVVFQEKRLTLGNVPGIASAFRPGDAYIFGHDSPKELGFLIGELNNAVRAKYMCVSMTSPEKLAADSWVWKEIGDSLGLNREDVAGYAKSAFDDGPYHRARLDYMDPAKKRIGVMIKLGMAIALAKKVGGRVLRNRVQQDSIGYNKCDFFVEAGTLQ
jgi:hypothetical protein